MKIKFDGFKYLALAEYSNTWIPFWEQGDASILFGKINAGNEIEVSDEMIYFQNCGNSYIRGTTNCPCSGLWPNPNCGHCGGVGLGATINA